MFNKSEPFYDAIYAWKDYKAEAARLKQLIAAHKISTGLALLDVACGTGGHIPHLSDTFAIEGVDLNLAMLEIAKEKHCSPSQLALAWVLAQGKDVVPIPGTKRRKYLEDNAGAVNVQLTKGDLQPIEDAFPTGAAAGERYPEHVMQLVDR